MTIFVRQIMDIIEDLLWTVCKVAKTDTAKKPRKHERHLFDKEKKNFSITFVLDRL